ncbi:Uncharacterized protein APZ42_012161 [Daphnia magna]|uniref:Ionotropic glutamate receptor C-terminal domain-containing protein n=1 Tax=Daphnia magna TaxID=35525 RepID=A0A162S4M2_9CRUS|nr:Uncharacterized protein APZ42_012161 [Daphnia magna]
MFSFTCWTEKPTAGGFTMTMLCLLSVLLGAVLLNSNVHSSKLVHEERQLLHGRQLRASAFSFSPCLSVTKTKSGNYSYSGICNDIVRWVSEHFQMELVYVPASNEDRVKFGLVPSLIRQIRNEEVDIIPFSFVITIPLALLIDFSFHLGVEDYHLLQPWPEMESNLMACIRPFSATVWLLFVVSTVALIICMAFLTHFNRQYIFKLTSFMQTMSDHAVYAITVITGQGNSVSAKERLSFRLLLGIWCLTMVVLVNAYTTTLTSYLTVPKLKPIVNTLAELAASHDTQMTVDFELGKARMFLEATSGPKKIIGDSLREHPQFLVKGSNLEGLKNVLEAGATYFTNRFIVKYFMAIDMKSHTNCRMTMSDPIPFIEYYSMGLPKGGRHNWIINHELKYLWENGLLAYWSKQYTPNVDKCMVAKAELRKERTALTLLDLSSAFMLLGLGIGSSLLVFFLEMMTHLKRMQQFRHATNAVIVQN